MQQLLLWAYLLGWCPGAIKGTQWSDNSKAEDQVWDPPSATQITFDVPQMFSPEASFFLSRALPRCFNSFPRVYSAQPLWGITLCQWHSSSLIHIQKLVKRAETLNWGTGSWKICLPGLKSCSVWTSKEMTRGRRAGQALYLPPEQQQLPCTPPIYLIHHQPWFLHEFFPNLSSHQCVTHWATLNEQFRSLYLQKSLKKTLIQI